MIIIDDQGFDNSPFFVSDTGTDRTKGPLQMLMHDKKKQQQKTV
jgi:hypothetical protein